MGRIIIEREDFYKKRHLRIFSGAIKKVLDVEPGDIVDCYDKNNKFLCVGYYNPKTNIAVRVLSFEKEKINREFFFRRIKLAYFKRLRLSSGDTNAFRIVYSESDFLPGLIVDKYDNNYVVQIETLGMSRFKEIIVDVLVELFKPVGVYERSDIEVRRIEGLSLFKGNLYGKEPSGLIKITENGINFLVDIKMGQKTGFYLDQRENRKKMLEIRSDKVFNLFSYTGSFGVYAVLSGAKEVINVDSSEYALEIAKENFRINGISDSIHKEIKSETEDYLKTMDKIKDFGTMVIIDPPNYVKKASDLKNGLKKYASFHRNIFYNMEKGLLFTFCCSGWIRRSEFLKMITETAINMKRNVNLIYLSSHPIDHPISLNVFETEYLKGALISV